MLGAEESQAPEMPTPDAPPAIERATERLLRLSPWWLLRRVRWWQHAWTFDWAHKPLCERFGADVVRLGRLHLCRGCLALRAGVLLGAVTLELAPRSEPELARLREQLRLSSGWLQAHAERRRREAEGGSKELTRTTSPGTSEVTVATALGRTYSYRAEKLAAGGKRLVTVSPCCERTELVVTPDGSRTMTLADGTVIEESRGPDPRWGMMAPVAVRRTMTSPQGRVTTLTRTREIELDEEGGPFVFRSLTSTLQIGDGEHRTIDEPGLCQMVNIEVIQEGV